jgi:uncharacterized coiled-coil DUF342 family protein
MKSSSKIRAGAVCLGMLILLCSLSGCAGKKPKPEEVYNPTPVIILEEEVFSGGLIIVKEENDHRYDIRSTDLGYFDGNDWILIDSHTGFDMDTDEKTGEWVFWWDIGDLEPGEYLLRAEMHEINGGYGSTEVEVMVAQKPEGRVSIRELNEELVSFSAEEFFDPNDSPLVHSWIFDTGELFSDSVVMIEAYTEKLPIIFTHTVTNQWGAYLTNTYMYSIGPLLSLVDHQININLGIWEVNLKDVVAEKEKLKAKLSDANKKHIDAANKKLKEAVKKIGEAKANLKKKPADEKKAKELLKEAEELIKEAIKDLEKVDQEKDKIKANIQKLQNLMDIIDLTLLEADYMLDRINDLQDIIADKKAIKGLAGDEKKALDELLKLLEEAKTLLDQAKEELLKSPPGIEKAKTRIDSARTRIKEAGEKIEGLKTPGKQLTDNLEKLKVLYLKLGLLSGKLWLLEKIGLDNPHADINFPDLFRNDYPKTFTGRGIIYFGKPPGAAHKDQDDNGWDDDVLCHELDHHFLYQKNKQPLAGGSHFYDEDLAEAVPKGQINKRGKEEGMKLAWSEGWANFSSCAKRKNPLYFDKNEEKNTDHFTVGKDLENDKCQNTGEKKMKPMKDHGPTYEGSVSGILWDLFDGPENTVKDEDKDEISIKFIWIWKAINELPYPENIEHFYHRLKKVLTDNKVCPQDPNEKKKFDAKLKEIFTKHKVAV